MASKVFSVQRTLTRELKLDVDTSFDPAQLGGEPLERRSITSVYFDTPARTLARAGVTLQRRTENGRSVWHLTLPRRGWRLDLEAAGGPNGPPRSLSQLLTGVTRRQPLESVATLRTARAGRRIRSADGIADVLLDRVDVLEGRRVRDRFAELELELLTGDEGTLKRLATALEARGANRANGVPKLFRILRVEEPQTPPRHADAAEHLRAAVAREWSAILAHDPGARLGDDPEDVHRMRVATRRLRALLRAGKTLVDQPWADGLRAELKWLADLLGAVRELDVMIALVKEERDQLEPEERKAVKPLLDQLVAARDEARSKLLKGLRSTSYLRLLETLEEAAVALPVTQADRPLPALARRELRKLEKALSALPRDPEDTDLHRARIKAKRARYAAELAEPAVGRRGRRFVRRAKRFQDVTGEHQDAVVAEERLGSLLDRTAPPSTAFAAGRLVERLEARRLAARARFPKEARRLRKAGRRAFT